jgi:chemotaxis protein methyltransferase CheR
LKNLNNLRSGVAKDVQNVELRIFQTKLMEACGLDLSCYKEKQVQRRLSAALAKSGHTSLDDYWRTLEKHPEMRRDLVDFLTINVSNFFRNAERFDDVRTKILPELLGTRKTLRIWSAGCSAGQEPYTIAIILKEMTETPRHYVLGTDVNKAVLQMARDGIYTEDDIKEVKPLVLAKYFVKQADKYVLSNNIKQMVQFKIHNLLSDPYETDFDLIICRNVMIYFTDKAKSDVFKGFHKSLRPGGVLFIGGTETLMSAPNYGFELIHPFLYRKVCE